MDAAETLACGHCRVEPDRWNVYSWQCAHCYHTMPVCELCDGHEDCPCPRCGLVTLKDASELSDADASISDSFDDFEDPRADRKCLVLLDLQNTCVTWNPHEHLLDSVRIPLHAARFVQTMLSPNKSSLHANWPSTHPCLSQWLPRLP